MEKIHFNLRGVISLQRILQGKFMHYLDHMNYKLKGRYVLIHSMILGDDPQSVFAQLVGVNQLDGVLKFHLQAEDFSGTQLVELKPNDVLILFDANEDRTEFVPRFIYWDDKYDPEPGLNLKTLVSVSRLNKMQLSKYFDHPNYVLNGRNAIVRPMLIDILHNDTIGRFVSISNSEQNYPIVMVNYADGFMSSQKHIGLAEDGTDNDLVLIIFDKDGINPEFIYWED